MRTFAALAVVASVGAGSPVAAQVTTRIETRPVYGAVVTLEHGVRVYRPLPPHDRVIINPGGRTPVVVNAGEGGYGYYGEPHGDGYGGDAAGVPYGFGGGAIFSRRFLHHRFGHQSFPQRHFLHRGHPHMGHPRR
jgi:hypothetical protein